MGDLTQPRYLLPARARQRLQALDGLLASVRDSDEEPLRTLADRVGHMYAGAAGNGPAVQAVVDHHLPQGPLLRLIEAARRDQMPQAHATFSQLQDHYRDTP